MCEPRKYIRTDQENDKCGSTFCPNMGRLFAQVRVDFLAKCGLTFCPGMGLLLPKCPGRAEAVGNFIRILKRNRLYTGSPEESEVSTAYRTNIDPKNFQTALYLANLWHPGWDEIPTSLAPFLTQHYRPTWRTREWNFVVSGRILKIRRSKFFEKWNLWKLPRDLVGRRIFVNGVIRWRRTRIRRIFIIRTHGWEIVVTSKSPSF